MEQDSSVIDIDAVNEVCEKFNVKESEVHAALLGGDPHDQLAIAYHLIIDNKRIADEAAKAELKDFYVASSPPPVAFSPSDTNNSPLRPHPERIARNYYFITRNLHFNIRFCLITGKYSLCYYLV